MKGGYERGGWRVQCPGSHHARVAMTTSMRFTMLACFSCFSMRISRRAVRGNPSDVCTFRISLRATKRPVRRHRPFHTCLRRGTHGELCSPCSRAATSHTQYPPVAALADLLQQLVVGKCVAPRTPAGPIHVPVCVSVRHVAGTNAVWGRWQAHRCVRALCSHAYNAKRARKLLPALPVCSRRSGARAGQRLRWVACYKQVQISSAWASGWMCLVLVAGVQRPLMNGAVSDPTKNQATWR